MKDNVHRHQSICTELTELYRKKNHDYGDSFHKSYEEFGLTMAAIRLDDKLNRFKTLIKAEGEVNDESIRDTLIDLANYAILTVMELDAENRDEVHSDCRISFVCPKCGSVFLKSPDDVWKDYINHVFVTNCPTCGEQIRAKFYEK